ncbi:DUF3122 domain-containing protein [Nodosilinea sp. LEGE 07088]|uniref:DUF3122 domain-containing protein n=1 Tax=Nodosilinea sp. LEGE 07088 TaxID=2777968 RepID=UPI001880CF4A|nr:DUF3122 domain-containing protein [Nodosilinea sp. LEGE 07088]MBE9136442.1 DUF3122 domain-containing protein [Nodosilinea sp. LEGE 07088]
MGNFVQKMVSQLAAIALLGACLLSVLVYPWPAQAAIRQLEEAPGQVVYQSRQTVSDQHGNTWQAIAFNRIRPDGSTRFYLRLVGFPGTAEIDRERPLTLITSLGQSLTAADASSDIFTDASAPEANVGQYDLQPIVSQLPAAIPLQLRLPNLAADDVVLPIAPSVIQEWKTTATYQ